MRHPHALKPVLSYGLRSPQHPTPKTQDPTPIFEAVVHAAFAAPARMKIRRPMPRMRPVRDAKKVARHFSAGIVGYLCRKSPRDG